MHSVDLDINDALRTRFQLWIQKTKHIFLNISYIYLLYFRWSNIFFILKLSQNSTTWPSSKSHTALPLTIFLATLYKSILKTGRDVKITYHVPITSGQVRFFSNRDRKLEVFLVRYFHIRQALRYCSIFNGRKYVRLALPSIYDQRNILL